MVKRQTSAVDRYLDLPYHITLVQDGEENGGKWVAAAEELPDCTSRADTAEEAIAGLKGAMADWIAVALKEGRDIPEPRSEATPQRASAPAHATDAARGADEGGRAREREPEPVHHGFARERRRLEARTDGGGGQHSGADQPGARCGRFDRGTALELAATRAASPVMAGAAAASDRRAHGELRARRDRRHDRDPRAHRRAALAQLRRFHGEGAPAARGLRARPARRGRRDAGRASSATGTGSRGGT